MHAKCFLGVCASGCAVGCVCVCTFNILYIKKKILITVSFRSDQQNGRWQSGREMKCDYQGTYCLCVISLRNGAANRSTLLWIQVPNSFTPPWMQRDFSSTMWKPPLTPTYERQGCSWRERSVEEVTPGEERVWWRDSCQSVWSVAKVI